MKRYFIEILLVTLLLSTCSAGEKDIEAHNAWVRPTAAGQNAAVYLTLHNHTDVADELIGITSNVADVIELHESQMENDVMQMSMLESLPLPADEEITFKPGGLHLMLVSIKQELVLGEHLGLVLHFKNHSDLVVNVHVENTVPEEDHDEH